MRRTLVSRGEMFLFMIRNKYLEMEVETEVESILMTLFVLNRL